MPPESEASLEQKSVKFVIDDSTYRKVPTGKPANPPRRHKNGGQALSKNQQHFHPLQLHLLFHIICTASELAHISRFETIRKKLTEEDVSEFEAVGKTYQVA